EMEDVVTLVIHHGGRVVWPDEYVPQYIEGSTFQMHIFKEEITYERLHQIARWELQYESADRMFYLPHGQNMSNGMVEIFSEMSVSHGLLYSGIDGVIIVYMTCIVNDEEFAGDNMTEGVGVQDRGADGDEEVQRSVAEGGLIHLIDDSDRTTDPEFYEALNNLGILGLRRKFRSQRADGGEEVDQVYEEMEASNGPSNHGPVNTGPAPTEIKKTYSVEETQPEVPPVPAVQRQRRQPPTPAEPPPSRQRQTAVAQGPRVRRCSICQQSGHNTRRCLRRMGIDAVQTGATPRQAEERDVQHALRGVGAYVSPETGNTYYRGSIARDQVLDARGSQPPVTQPSE
ncbi:hypothetical protein LINGRAHAP2_LOCUS6740, partial [Linum grandiflorum]